MKYQKYTKSQKENTEQWLPKARITVHVVAKESDTTERLNSKGERKTGNGYCFSFTRWKGLQPAVR